MYAKYLCFMFASLYLLFDAFTIYLEVPLKQNILVILSIIYTDLRALENLLIDAEKCVEKAPIILPVFLARPQFL